MDYKPPLLLFNRHLETIYPALLRRVNGITYERERINTPDNDFIDLDWLRQGAKKLVVISHGLEGNTQRAYMMGMAKIFFHHQHDVLTWNYRGCSEELNNQLRFYHSGATDDLELVVQHAMKHHYESVFLIGFSLGGNLTLKYLGEKGIHLPGAIKKAMAISVPLNLYTSCLKISEPANWIYTQRFLKSLKAKVVAKSKKWPQLDTKRLTKIHTLIEFDDYYTAPLHGFSGALDYYDRCSAIRFIEQIKIPTLIVNARNDPFLSNDCYPTHLKGHAYLQTEFPARGGHVGFALLNQNGLYWSELRALQFFQSGK
jgi:predicted alpha/beta-fold hydrolase